MKLKHDLGYYIFTNLIIVFIFILPFLCCMWIIKKDYINAFLTSMLFMIYIYIIMEEKTR